MMLKMLLLFEMIQAWKEGGKGGTAMRCKTVIEGVEQGVIQKHDVLDVVVVIVVVDDVGVV